MNTLKKHLLLIILTIGYTLTAQSQTITPDTDYLDLMDKSLYMEYSKVRMEVYKNDKLLKHYGMELYRKGEKMRMEFYEPAVEKGRRMLNDENNLWMYMPRTSKVMKLPLKQAFMGSDASNRDLMRLAYKKDYDIVSIQSGEGNMILIELKAKDLSISYHKMIISFDKQKKVPVKQEMYSLSNKLIKTMEFTYVKQSNGKYVCETSIIRDELLKNSITKMYYNEAKQANNKPDVFFTLGSIKQ